MAAVLSVWAAVDDGVAVDAAGVSPVLCVADDGVPAAAAVVLLLGFAVEEDPDVDVGVGVDVDVGWTDEVGLGTLAAWPGFLLWSWSITQLALPPSQ